MTKPFKRILVCLLALCVGLQAEPSDQETTARKLALELAGAFGNDGFKLRDGHWSGPIETGRARLIQVNLFAGNQYWFSLAATPQAKKLALQIYDETGAPMTIDLIADGAKVAGGFAPEASGTYYVKLEELTGAPAAFCLIYSYK